jgi:hypothetical protein
VLALDATRVQLLQADPWKFVPSSSEAARPWHGTTRAPSRGADRHWSADPSRWSSWRVNSTDVSMTMLWTLFVVLLVLWLLGVVSSYTLGGFIHLLLVLAIVAVLVQLISGRRAV